MVHVLIIGVFKVNGYAFKESSMLASLFNGSTTSHWSKFCVLGAHQTLEGFGHLRK